MDRKLLDYLPPVLREVMEMQAINEANEPEIAAAWDALALVLANQFLETADARGVAVWEKELKIFPKDTDTLEDRKRTIKAKWGLELPYTMVWLRNWLTSVCGPLLHEETLDNYTLGIHIYNEGVSGVDTDIRSLTDRILKILQPVCPANILLLLNSTVTELESFATLRITPILGCCISTTRLPELEPEPLPPARLCIAGAPLGCIAETKLPELEEIL